MAFCADRKSPKNCQRGEGFQVPCPFCPFGTLSRPLLAFGHFPPPGGIGPLVGGIGLSPLKSPLLETTNQGASAPYWMYPQGLAVTWRFSGEPAEQAMKRAGECGPGTRVALFDGVPANPRASRRRADEDIRPYEKAVTCAADGSGTGPYLINKPGRRATHTKTGRSDEKRHPCRRLSLRAQKGNEVSRKVLCQAFFQESGGPPSLHYI